MTSHCKELDAWIDEMPPGPSTFHIGGEVTVANPGVQAVLTKRQPQGINPAILLMELNLVQKPGTWMQNITCASVTFSEQIPAGMPRYTTVEISSKDGPIKIENVRVTS